MSEAVVLPDDSFTRELAGAVAVQYANVTIEVRIFGWLSVRTARWSGARGTSSRAARTG